MTPRIYHPNSKNKKEDFQAVMDVIKGSPLQKIIQKARLIMALEDQLKNILPDNFANQCTVANIHANSVIIHVQSAAIATRLRFQEQEILQKINKIKQFSVVRGVQFKVRPK